MVGDATCKITKILLYCPLPRIGMPSAQNGGTLYEGTSSHSVTSFLKLYHHLSLVHQLIYLSIQSFYSFYLEINIFMLTG